MTGWIDGGPSMREFRRTSLTRREILKTGLRLGVGLPGIAAILAACGGTAPALATPSTANVAPSTATTGGRSGSTSPTAGALGGASSGTVTIGLTYDVTTLDATMQYDAQTINVYGNIYDTLLRKDQDLNIQPSVAESYKAVDDTTWELKLRKGVKFHNGDDFTADDVKFTIERVLDPKVASPQFSNISGYDRVEVVDPSTVRIITKKPFPLVPITLCNLRIVPAKYFQDKGPEYVATHPVGSGPYKFVEWAKGASLTLEANPSYWNGAPSIKQAIFKIIPEDATRIAALQTKNADLILAVPPINAPDLEKSADVTVAKTLIERISWVETQALATSGRPTAKPEVRKAIAYAVDRDALIKSLLLGNGQKIATMLTPKHIGYSPDISGYELDLNQAKGLLTAAGYPNGVDLDMIAVSGGQNKEIAEAIGGQLAKAGMRVKVSMLEGAALLAAWQKHDFGDLILATWTSNTFDADGTLYPLFHSGTVWANFSNPAMDQVLEQARSTLDKTERDKSYKQALQILHDEMPGVPLWEQMAIYGLSKRLKWKPRPDQELFLTEMVLTG